MNKIELKNLVKILQIAVVLAFLYTLIWPLFAYFDKLYIGYRINGVPWSAYIPELAKLDMIFVYTLTSIKDLIWLFGLFQIFLLCRNYKEDCKIFSSDNAKLLSNFGFILVLMAVSRTLIQPILSYYFFWRGISPGLADSTLILNIDLDLLMIGLFFFVIAKIMEKASKINEENQLTI